MSVGIYSVVQYLISNTRNLPFERLHFLPQCVYLHVEMCISTGWPLLKRRRTILAYHATLKSIIEKFADRGPFDILSRGGYHGVWPRAYEVC